MAQVDGGLIDSERAIAGATCAGSQCVKYASRNQLDTFLCIWQSGAFGACCDVSDLAMLSAAALSATVLSGTVRRICGGWKLVGGG